MASAKNIIDASALATVEVLNDSGLVDNACILGTRILIETTAYHGLTMKPQAASMAAFNRAGWELNQAEVPYKEWPDGAWSVGVDPDLPARPGNYRAHLIARYRDVLVDTTAVQMARPKRGLHVPREPLMFELPEGWDSNKPAIWVDTMDAAWQTVILYYPYDAPEFRDAPNWKSGKYKPYVSKAIRLSRELLDAERRAG